MLVDDHAIVRDGIHQLFACCPDLVIDCEAATCEEALDLIARRSVDGVLLDLSMPDGDGMNVLRTMKKLRADVPVLVFSMHAEEQYGLNALKAGASGYLEKSNAADEIVHATRTVLTGLKYVSPALAEQLATGATEGDLHKAPHEKLSPRELQVFHLLASGMTVSDLGRHLTLSVKTVATHRTRILSKMNLTTNAALTYYALKNGLID